MAPKKSKRLLKDSQTPALSAGICEAKSISVKKKFDMEDVAEKIFNEVNRKELERSLDKWLKDNHTQNAIAMRDLGLLKAIVSEYLDSFIVFGYTLEGERVILQNYEKARDRDAIMEFLKTIFIKQQQENFLD
jgi:hypothetical protein